ncbi:hypothetical protein JW898_00670 [Candidatus Woesearchaeota archaeon]|nr:hypothetical protein [Candidatus Woesearchaeota archaeon]
MAGQTYLKATLTLMALYAGIMGALTLMFQDAGSYVFQYTIKDPVLARYWGGVLMAMAVFYLFLSLDPQKYQLFLWVGVLDLGIAMILTVMNIAIADMNWIQGIIGLVINPILIILLLYGLAKEPEGTVIFVAGESKQGAQVQELPEHASTRKHPLQGK